jgi:hypothetical protein
MFAVILLVGRLRDAARAAANGAAVDHFISFEMSATATTSAA